MRASAYALAAALCAVPALAAAQNPVSDAYRGQTERAARIITEAVDMFPADKFGYQPTPVQMSGGRDRGAPRRRGQLLPVLEGQRDRPSRSATKVDTTASRRKRWWPRSARASTSARRRAAGLTDAQLADSVASFGPRKIMRANMVLITVGRLGGPLQPAGELPAAERHGAADGARRGHVVSEGLGVGDWGLGSQPNTPTPNPETPIFRLSGCPRSSSGPHAAFDAPGSSAHHATHRELLVGFHKVGSGKRSHHLSRGAGRGALLRVDRRGAEEPRRDQLHRPFHAAQAGQHLERGQRRARRGARGRRA